MQTVIKNATFHLNPPAIVQYTAGTAIRNAKTAAVNKKDVHGLRKMIFLIVICGMLVMNMGCGLLGTALSAGAAYGIYKATHH